MKALIRAALANRVAPNLLMVGLLVAGVLSALTLTVKQFPEIAVGAVQVSVAFPGATPAEVADAVIVPIEDQVESVEGVRKITSIAASGLATVTLELERGADPRRAVDDVENEIDRITVFPDGIETPRVTEVEPDELAVQLILAGGADRLRLKSLAEQVRDNLLDQDGISRVELSGVPTDQVDIEVSLATLREYGIGLPEFARRVGAQTLDLSGGRIDSATSTTLLRTLGERETASGLRELVMFVSTSGAQVRLGDIARVRERFADDPVIARLDGEPAVVVSVFRVGDEQILDSVDTTRRYLEDTLRPRLPDGVRAVLWRDEAEQLRGRIQLLSKNGLIGVVLILLILALFLDLRIAAWVAVGVVVSFVGALIPMSLFGVSVNQLSLFGFILALGIVVDDAIVVGEGVYAEQKRADGPHQAALNAAARMARPIFYAVSTTVVVFVPLLFLPGSSGSFIAPIAAVVIFVLALSLVESFFVLPQHLSHVRPGPPRRWSPRRLFEPLRRRVGGATERFAGGAFGGWVEFSVRHPLFVIVAALSLLLASLGLLAGGQVKFVFFPSVEGNFVTATLELPENSAEQATLDSARRLAAGAERAAAVVAGRYDDPAAEAIEGVATAVGFSIAVGGPDPQAAPGTANTAAVEVKLIDAARRSFSAAEFQAAWRDAVGEIPGAKRLTYSADLIGVGAPVQLRVSADDPAASDRAVGEIRAALAERDGVFDVRDDRFSAAQEVAIELKPVARVYGLTLSELAADVRAAFFGALAAQVQRDREEVDVRVRLPADERDSIADLENYRVKVGDGFVPLRTVAELTFRPAPSVITRVDGRRVTTVSAEVDERLTTGGVETARILDRLVPELRRADPSLRVVVGGEQEEQGRTGPALTRNFVLAMFAVYAILALAFKSYTRPLIVLLTVPFGFIGALLGHALLGLNLTLLSLFGVIGLSGITVNGALLIVDNILEREADGVDPFTAIKEATAARFRPILLTTLTTFFGVFPLVLEQSVQAQFLIPTAAALGFGVLGGSLLLLGLVPAYASLHARARVGCAPAAAAA